MSKKHGHTAKEATGTAGDPAHAPGKRHTGPPREQPQGHHGAPTTRMHSQPWVPSSGRVGRSRRSARRG